MIDVKEAIASAKHAVSSFYEAENLVDLRLEEVELSDDERIWQITLGFYVLNINPTQSPLAIAIVGGSKKYVREYKVFRIDAESGEFRSMKIREA